MKKQVIVALALSASLLGFAQKKEVKAFEKLVKKENFVEAKAMISQLEPMLGAMDETMKAKYYLNKAKALFNNGAILPQDIDAALKSLNNAEGAYKSEVGQIKKMIEQSSLAKTNKLYTSGNYTAAAKGYNMLFELSKDGVYLYNAALVAMQAKENDLALEYFLKLKDTGYTGEGLEYYAISKETGKEELFDKATRDSYVKIGTHIKPTERKTGSKVPEIVKNIALLYKNKGENDKALAALKEARAQNPNDGSLIITEANIYLELKDSKKASELFKEAIAKNPGNADLIYNVGVLAMNDNQIEEAKTYFMKTLESDPSYADAAQGLSTLKINDGNSYIPKMNALGASAADFKKYDEYKATKERLFSEGAQILVDFISKNPNTKNVGLLTQLKNIYGAIGETGKSKEIQSKIDALGSN